MRDSGLEDAGAPLRWPAWDRARLWPAATAVPFLSVGHGTGELVALVRLSPGVREHYLRIGPGRFMPPGSIVVQWLSDRRSDELVNVLVMEKLEKQRWKYLVLRPDGTVDATANLSLCERCHTEAPADSIFGVPSEPRLPEARP